MAKFVKQKRHGIVTFSVHDKDLKGGKVARFGPNWPPTLYIMSERQVIYGQAAGTPCPVTRSRLVRADADGAGCAAFPVHAPA